MKRKIIIEIHYTNNLLDSLVSSRRRVPCLRDAIRVLALKSSAAGRDATFAGASLIFARLVSARGESAVIEEGKSIGRRSGWPFRFNGPRWNGLYQRWLHASERERVRCTMPILSTLRRVEVRGFRDCLGSPMNFHQSAKNRDVFRSNSATSERYIHKWQRDPRYCFHIRDPRYFFILFFRSWHPVRNEFLFFS